MKVHLPSEFGVYFDLWIHTFYMLPLFWTNVRFMQAFGFDY